jgi:hypothetical protein
MKRLSLLFLMGLLTMGFAQPSWSAPTPIVEYLFNEGSGTTALNTGSLGNGTNGTINGASYSSDIHLGLGFSLEFDGINDFVRVLDTFDYGNQLTVEAWIKPDAVEDRRNIWDDYGNPGVVFKISNGGLQFSISTPEHPGPGITVYDGTINVSEWQHVAGIYDGSEMRVYINGVHTGEIKSTSGTIIDNPGSPTYAAIGSSNVEPNLLNFNGKIDDFRIFNVALNPSELANGYFANQCPVADAGPDLIILSRDQDFTVIQGTASDPDDDPLIYRWLEGTAELSAWRDVGENGETYLDLSTVSIFFIGDHTLTLEVNDGSFTSTDEMVLTVEPLTIDAILIFFDDSVYKGELYGRGSGWVAKFRLILMRQLLVSAGDYIERDKIKIACFLLHRACLRCDKEPWPRDYVEGEATEELAEMIYDLEVSLECEWVEGFL